MSYNITMSGIKSWAEDDRPREKLLLKGRSTLSDAELLAILIGKGTREHNAVDLAKLILRSVDNDLHKLAKISIGELKKIKGIGEVKAITILAAMELARRKKDFEKQARTFITDSKSSYEHFKPYLLDLNHEEFWVLILSRRMEVMKTLQISSGGAAGTVVDPKLVFHHAINNVCYGVLLCHNHPSGTLKPSEEDLKLTQRLKAGAGYLGIALVDHLIFTNNGYYSFADNGIL